MKTISFEELLREVMALWTGRNELPDTEHYPRLRGKMDLSLQIAWSREFWRDLMRIERRFFRPNWVNGTSYVQGDEVYDQNSQGYFQCVRATSSQAPTDSGLVENSGYWAACATAYTAANWVSGTSYAIGDQVYYLPTSTFYQCIQATSSVVCTNTSYWGPLTPFDRYIAWEQSGENEIGKLFACRTDNHFVTTNYDDLDAWESYQGIQVRDNVTSCYVFYRQPCPRLKGDSWSATASYAVGDQVYFTPTGDKGNLYDCISSASAGDSPSTDPEKWDQVDIPIDFANFLVWSTYARCLSGDDKTDIKNDAMEMAEEYLSQAIDNARSPDQTPSRSVRTY